MRFVPFGNGTSPVSFSFDYVRSDHPSVSMLATRKIDEIVDLKSFRKETLKLIQIWRVN